MYNYIQEKYYKMSSSCGLIVYERKKPHFLFSQELAMNKNFETVSDSQAMRIQHALQTKSQKTLKRVEGDADNVYMRNKQFKLKEPNFFDRLIKLATMKLF